MQIPKIPTSSLPLGDGRAESLPLRACDVPQLMLLHGVPYTEVSTLNWPANYPYKPRVEVALAHTGSALLIHYRVAEQCIRAVAEADGGRVWEDSCCELFVQPEQDGPYYNLECNCGATLLVAAGEDRHHRRQAPLSVMQAIDRWSSLGRAPIAMSQGNHQWQLALVVPATTLFESAVADFTGRAMRGNVYKCGDCLAVPHFLSLYPIATPSPDFHRPDFFQPLEFGA